MKINSYINIRYSLKDKSFNIEKRFINPDVEIYRAGDSDSIDNVNSDMISITKTLNNSLPQVKLIDVERLYDSSYPIMVEGNTLKFGVTMAKTRLEREMGKDLYVVRISKLIIND